MRGVAERARPWGGEQLLFAGLFLGILSGSVVGLFSPSASLRLAGLTLGPYPVPDHPGFVRTLWDMSLGFLLLALGATSYLGFAAALSVPCLGAFRFSCSVAALFAAGGYPGLLEALLRYGVPALALLPSLLLAAGECLAAAKRLLQLRFRGPVPPAFRRPLPALCAVASVLISAAYVVYGMPLLLR